LEDRKFRGQGNRRTECAPKTLSPSSRGRTIADSPPCIASTELVIGEKNAEGEKEDQRKSCPKERADEATSSVKGRKGRRKKLSKKEERKRAMAFALCYQRIIATLESVNVSAITKRGEARERKRVPELGRLKKLDQVIAKSISPHRPKEHGREISLTQYSKLQS